MKLSHRRVKKALKKSKQLPWEKVMIARGQRRLKKRAVMARKIAMSAIASGMAASRIMAIRQTPSYSPYEKAKAIFDSCIDAAYAIAKIHSENI